MSSLVRLDRLYQSCFQFRPLVLLLCDSCKAFSAIASVFLLPRLDLFCSSATSASSQLRAQRPRGSFVIRHSFLCPLWLRPAVLLFVAQVGFLFSDFPRSSSVVVLESDRASVSRSSIGWDGWIMVSLSWCVSPTGVVWCLRTQQRSTARCIARRVAGW